MRMLAAILLTANSAVFGATSGEWTWGSFISSSSGERECYVSIIEEVDDDVEKDLHLIINIDQKALDTNGTPFLQSTEVVGFNYYNDYNMVIGGKIFKARGGIVSNFGEMIESMSEAEEVNVFVPPHSLKLPLKNFKESYRFSYQLCRNLI